MSNTSIAVQAVAAGPRTDAPASFNGNDVLVVINLAVFTAAFFIMLSIAWHFAASIWQRRRPWRNANGIWQSADQWSHPVTIWRGIGLLVSSAGVLRFGFAAAVLWGWNPLDPVFTASILVLQRFFDPIAATLGVCAMALFILSERGMVEQLRKEPFPLNMWASLPMLKRPAIIAALSLAAAIGVVCTR